VLSDPSANKGRSPSCLRIRFNGLASTSRNAAWKAPTSSAVIAFRRSAGILRLVEKARNAFLDFEVPVTMIETHSAKLPLKLSILRDD
jgi:hypothetical protein